MAQKVDYNTFLKFLDAKLDSYFKSFGTEIACKKGCSACCEKGDYPLSNLELEYLMKGYSKLDNGEKVKIQDNIKNIVKGGKCPFLIDNECSVYEYRPIVCRVHGLAYLFQDNVVKVPYCANNGKCFKNSYTEGQFEGNPIKENLDTYVLLKDYDCEIRNLYDWINNT